MEKLATEPITSQNSYSRIFIIPLWCDIERLLLALCELTSLVFINCIFKVITKNNNAKSGKMVFFYEKCFHISCDVTNLGTKLNCSLNTYKLLRFTSWWEAVNLVWRKKSRFYFYLRKIDTTPGWLKTLNLVFQRLPLLRDLTEYHLVAINF